jgi:molecular chaperone DnaK
MTEEAKRFKDEDRKKLELAEAKNGADTLIYSIEKSLKELGEKVSAGDANSIAAAIAELNEAVRSSHVSTIKTRTATLAQVAMKLGEALYDELQPGGPGVSRENVVSGDSAQPRSDNKKWL